MKDYKLSDIFDIQIGKTPSRSKKEYWGEGSSWLSIKDMSNLEENKYIFQSKEQITNSAISDTNIKIVPAKTLIYSFKLSIGKVAITKKPIYTNEAIAAFLPKKDSPISIDIDYIFYLLKSKDVSSLVHNAVKGKSLNKSKLNNMIVSLPIYEEQKRRAKKLNQIQELINKRTKTIDLLYEYINSAFLDTFGDPILNPKKWNKATIIGIVKDEHNSIRRGPFGGNLKKQDFVDKGYLVYEQYHALNDDFTFERYFINEEKYQKLKNFRISENDIIISCSGVNLGKLAIIPKNYKEGIINQALLKVSLDENKMLPKFFVQVFTNSNFKKKYLTKRGVGIPNFPPMTEFKKFEFIVPPIETQEKFLVNLKEINKQKERNQKSLTLLEELFKSVLYQTFYKKQEIKEDEIDKFINDELEIDILLADIKNTEMFDTFTQYDIAKSKLFNILERTELRIREASDKEKSFSKGLIQKLNKGNIELDYNEPFKPIKHEVS